MDDELRKILDTLFSADQARKAAEKEQEKGNSPVASSFWNIAIAKSETALDALNELCSHPLPARTPLSAEMVRTIERDYDLEPDVLGTTLREHQEQSRKYYLDLVLKELDKDLAEREPGRGLSDLIERIVRIGSAIVIGALVGAPLAALAVQESIVNEMIKAGIATGLASVAAEVTDTVLAREPSEPVYSTEDVTFTEPGDLIIEHDELELSDQVEPEEPELELDELELGGPAEPEEPEPARPEELEWDDEPERGFGL